MSELKLHPPIIKERFKSPVRSRNSLRVTRSAWATLRGLAGVGSGGDGGLGRLTVDLAVHGGIAQDDLDVLTCLCKGDGLDEFGNFLVAAFGLPESDAVFTSVVRSGSVFKAAGRAG